MSKTLTSTNKAILNLTVINGFGAILSIFFSMLQAYYFGVSRVIEVFFATQVIFNIVSKLSQAGHLSDIFMPIYHKIKSAQGKEEAQKALSVLFNCLFLFFVFISIIIWISLKWTLPLIMPGFSSLDQTLGLNIIKALLIFLPIQLLNVLLNIPFTSEKKYGRQELVSMSNRFINIMVIIFFYNHLKIWALALSMILGILFTFLIYVILLFREGFNYKLAFTSNHFKMTDILRTLTNTFLYTGVTQFYTIVLNSMATFLPSGYFAVYKYVELLLKKINSIILRPVSIVFFTEFSEGFSQNLQNLKHKISNSLNKSLFIYFIILISMIVSGKAILNFLWGGGKFDENYISLAYVLMIVFFSLLFFSIIEQIYTKINIATGFANEYFKGAALVQLLSAFFSWILIKYFQWFGIYYIITLNQVLLFSNAFFILYKHNKEFIYFYSLKTLFKWLIVFLLSISIGLFLSTPLSHNLGVSKISDFINMTSTTLISLVISIFFSYILGIQETKHIIRYTIEKSKYVIHLFLKRFTHT